MFILFFANIYVCDDVRPLAWIADVHRDSSLFIGNPQFQLEAKLFCGGGILTSLQKWFSFMRFHGRDCMMRRPSCGIGPVPPPLHVLGSIAAFGVGGNAPCDVQYWMRAHSQFVLPRIKAFDTNSTNNLGCFRPSSPKLELLPIKIPLLRRPWKVIAILLLDVIDHMIIP